MNALARIIDANSNRAREAIRVMEDVARFGLNNPSLSRALKDLRHGLRAALSSLTLGKDALLASRDSEQDVGTRIAGEGEYERQGIRGIARAAACRLTEALRSIEEAAKGLGDVPAAQAIEQLRYRAYTVEQQLMSALAGSRPRQWRLCVLLTESLCTIGWREVAEASVDGGADCVQLREKHLPDGELMARARWLRSLTTKHGVSLVINDRADIAALCGADGVHLGQSDLAVAEVRQVVGMNALVGVSTESLGQARAAAEAGADYCGVGPMFLTATKNKPRVAGPEYLREYLADTMTSSLPHLAIGGINDDNIGQLAALGCKGVAVSSGVCAAKEPAAVCRRLLASLAVERHVATSRGSPSGV